MALDIKATNVAIAAALVSSGLVPRAFPWPVESVQTGEALVGYPSALTMAATFGRGMDRATIPVWIICGLPQDESTLTRVSALVTGSTDILDVLDGSISGAVQSCSAQFGAFESVAIGGIERLAVRFDLDIIA